MAASVSLPQGVVGAARRLRDEGCCGLCVLRLCGVSDRACYRLPLASVERQLDAQVGGRQGGIRSCARPPAPGAAGGGGRGPPPGIAAAAAGGGRGPPPGIVAAARKVRAFVTTEDATLFSGAKLVQVEATDATELAKSIAEAVGHPGVTLEVRLNGKTLLGTAAAVEALGDNPRLAVKRSPLQQAPAAAAAAADTATAMEEAPPAAAASNEPEAVAVAAPVAAAAEEEPEFVCCACLGLLQHATSSLCGEMIRFIQTDGWECPAGQTALLGLAIPSDVLVRQRLLEMVGYPDQRPMHRLVDLKTTMHQLFVSVPCLLCKSLRLVYLSRGADDCMFA